jgi:hypothetical protein
VSDLEAKILVLLAAGTEAADIATDVGTDQVSLKEHIKSILRKAISSGRPVGGPTATDLHSSDLVTAKMLSPFTA